MLTPPRWYAPAQMPALDLAQYDRDMAHYVAETFPTDVWDVVSVLRLRVEVNVLGGPQDGAGEQGKDDGGQAGWATSGK